MDESALPAIPATALSIELQPAPAAVIAPTPWGKGFHGALEPSHVGSLGTVSLREIAMSRRSLGLQRMATLITLPAETARLTPRKSLGSAAVGLSVDDDFPDDAVLISDATRRYPDEPLPHYIDRRLADAERVYLPNRGLAYAITKRLIDIIAAVFLLTLTAPVLLTLAILIRVDSPGRAIFVQERVTEGGRIFRFYKFRTMWTDAKVRYPNLYAYEFGSSANSDVYYKLADDPRNTRVGRWLRRTTLDELPNLLNVLKGDMSLVGPRPELPELVEKYRPEELACFFTKAGLTGLAQVAGRSLLTMRERLTLDVRYVAQQTTLLDLRILWRTAIVVLTGRGAF